MGDFNRKGTPISKIMTYDRYNMKKKYTTVKCDEKTSFDVYFRLNMDSGSFFLTFI